MNGVTLNTDRSSPCAEYAADLLRNELAALGIAVENSNPQLPQLRLGISESSQASAQSFEILWTPKADFHELYDPIFSWSDRAAAEALKPADSGANRLGGQITASDGPGLIYGVLEFIERCQVRRSLPIRPLSLRRDPQLRLRSACLLLMKRGNYLIPIVPREFPWFYDKAWWTRYLDFMVAQRFNAVTLWNFHPFPFFCQIPGHPEVNELPDHERESNRQMLAWLCQEFARRGMWLLFHFYNIYVCQSFADAHSLKALCNSFAPDEEKLVCDYTRSCVRTFVNEFPQVGLMACVGEGVPGGKAEKYTADVLLSAINETDRRPPFVLRQWATLSPEKVAEHVLGRYDNLYAMIKHNAEQISSPVPDSRVSRWVELGIPLLVNMHMLSEVNPFRWAPPSFIRECALHYQALGVKGVHVYPHWSWRTPGTGDLGLTQNETERDWLYHEAWGRYAFDPIRDPDEERRHWVRRFVARGNSKPQAEAMLQAYEITGPTLPRLQQHLWVHYDNHSVLTGGFTLGQLRLARSVHGRKIVRADRLEDLLPLRAELNGQAPGPGDYTFADALARSREEADRAGTALQPHLAGSDPRSEVHRLADDVAGIQATVEFLDLKAEAARRVFTWQRTGQLSVLHDGISVLRRSVDVYRRLAAQMEKRYVGISDVGPLYPFFAYSSPKMPYSWSECLQWFELESKNLETVLQIEESELEWSLFWHLDSLSDGPYAELERSTTARGAWLQGNPDFLKWPWRFERLRTVVVTASDCWDSHEYSMLSGVEDFRRWLEGGGTFVFYSHPVFRWSERELLSRLLGLEGAQRLGAQRCATPQGRAYGISSTSGSWNWSEKSGDLGLTGEARVGRGTIHLRALFAQ